MAIQKTKSYILRRIPFRETSWMLTCLTESFGKIKGIVKGVRKEKSKFASACELFCHSSIVYYEKSKSSFHLITDFSIVDPHEKLRSNFTAFTYAGYFGELLDELLQENEQNISIYELFRTAITLLEKNAQPADLLARAFEVKLLMELGFLPYLSECMECGNELSGSVYFSPNSGGVFCRTCHEKVRSGFLISNGSLQAIRFLAKQEMSKMGQFRAGPQISAELSHITKRFIENHIDRPLKSLHFIHQVKKVLKQTISV